MLLPKLHDIASHPKTPNKFGGSEQLLLHSLFDARLRSNDVYTLPDGTGFSAGPIMDGPVRAILRDFTPAPIIGAFCASCIEGFEITALSFELTNRL